MEQRDPGPFDRILQAEPPRQRDVAATVIVGAAVLLGALLLVLVLPPISILSGGGCSSLGVVTTARDDFPPPPAGYEAVSALLEVSSSGSSRCPARLTSKLTVPVSADDQLSLFTYQGGNWRRLGDATVLGDGVAAQGEVPVLPGNVAVLRQAQGARLVFGSLPAGGTLDPRAAGALTTLNIAGFSPSPAGAVLGEAPRPASSIDVAPTISATTDAEIATVNQILGSSALSAVHVQSVREFAAAGSYASIDLDYRSIDPALNKEFVSFVRDLSAALAKDGRRLTLTLPLPSRTADGWDTLGYDWEQLAPLVSAIKLAPVAEGDQYYARTEAALGYLVPRVGSAKLLLTVSPLSHERGSDGVRALPLTEALSLAGTPALQGSGPPAAGASVQVGGSNLVNGAGTGGLHWDDTARAVSFSYTGSGGERTAWLANLFSEGFKIDLARQYALAGIAIEDVSQAAADANIWPAVLQYAETGAVELVKPNGQLLQPQWTASGGQLESAGGALVTWRAPSEPGTYTLTLIVSDGVLRVGQELIVSVQAPGSAARP